MKKYVFQNKLLLIISILFGTIYSIGATLVAFILSEVMDAALAKDMDAFRSVVFLTIFYLVFLGVCYLIYSTLSKKFIGKIIYALRGDIFNGVFKKNIQDFRAVNSADYLSALSNDVKLVEENYLVPLLLCLHNILIFLTSLFIMIYFSPLVTICLFIAMLLLIAIPNIFKGVLQKRQDRFSKKLSELTIIIKDFLSGFEVIRSYRMNKHVSEAFQSENEDTFKSKYSMDRIVAAVESISTILGVMVQCSVLFVSAYLIITGKLTAGILVALVQVTGTIVAPIQVLSQNVPKIQGTKPIITRLITFINSRDTSFNGHETPTFQDEINVTNLKFGYNNNSVINDISFSFKHNKKYAVIGKSGCGKTTLINLLNGYYSDYKGQIIYDKKDMRQLDIEKLNEMAAVIHQNVYMFDDSIKNNICLYKPVSNKDLEYALIMSGVQMFLDDTKDLDSPVGENGSNLSGGQRQRIAVARALVQKKPILVLDEGTSAIDMQTAYDIESRLLKLDNLTLITITHSLNPELLNSYDCVIFMESGKICEVGTFEELINEKAKFYDFYKVKTK